MARHRDLDAAGPDDGSPLRVAIRPGIPPETAAIVEGILDDRQLARALAVLGGTPRVRVEAVIAAGSTLAAAHGNWHPDAMGRLSGLAPFARQADDAVTPGGIVRVSCECVHAPSGGMSSYYGFEGHFVSLLVSVPARVIWDARSEPAS